MSKKYPFNNAKIELFYIPFTKYNVTVNINSLYRDAMKEVRGLIQQWFKDINAPERQKNRIGFYTINGNQMRMIFPQGEKSSSGHGRDIVRFYSKWFEGNYFAGFLIGGNNFDLNNISISFVGAVKVSRGRVYAAVKYNNQWKACEIRTE